LFIAEAFNNPSAGYYTPTLIAYSLALAQKVLGRVSEVGSNLTLQLLYYFGASLVSLGGPPNLLQIQALNAIPKDIRTLENKYNFDIPTVLYAVCPICNTLYHPEKSSRASSSPAYASSICSNRSPPASPPCGAQILDDNGRPFKYYEYYPFSDWFAKFVAQPRILQYADEFCKKVRQNPIPPTDKLETSDGAIYRELQDHAGGCFVTDGGEEARFIFLLHSDFFNLEGTTGRKKHHSTGIVSLKCLNLPLEIRDDPVNVYVPGFFRGRKEPKGVDAQHSHLFEPVIRDLIAAYYRGIHCRVNGNTQKAIGDPEEWRTCRSTVAGVCMDLKAARPSTGFLDSTSHHNCIRCKNFGTSALGNTDYKNWMVADDERYHEGALKWKDAQTKSERSWIQNIYGTRYSVFWELPGFSPTKQIIGDPMHIKFINQQGKFWKECLCLEEPSKEAKEPFVSNIAFHYSFTPAPQPSAHIGSFEEYLLYLEWNDLPEDCRDLRLNRIHQWLRPHLQSDRRSLVDITRGHQLLSASRPSPSTKNQLLKKLSKLKWISLVYICNDLWIQPVSNSTDIELSKSKEIQRKKMANALINWVCCDLCK
jgi:hypothetical protein